MLKHVLKNCLLPVITLAGMNLASLVTRAFIIKSVFGWPGMGTLGMSAINSRDYPMIMAFTMLSCLILIIGIGLRICCMALQILVLNKEVRKIGKC